jgi:hypothetical protein
MLDVRTMAVRRRKLHRAFGGRGRRRVFGGLSGGLFGQKIGKEVAGVEGTEGTEMEDVEVLRPVRNRRWQF